MLEELLGDHIGAITVSCSSCWKTTWRGLSVSNRSRCSWVSKVGTCQLPASTMRVLLLGIHKEGLDSYQYLGEAGDPQDGLDQGAIEGAAGEPQVGQVRQQ